MEEEPSWNDKDGGDSHPETSQKTVTELVAVNSTAVVKYTKMGPMGAYSTLELNTDIKQAPDNWLHDNLQGRFSDWTSTRHDGSTDLSSFNMAHIFLENINDVDVISDAENIKKLLKMPFSKTALSLSVNKIGKTLLLDNFDVQNVLSQAAQKEELDNMRWLQDLFSEAANIEKNQTIHRRKKNPEDSRERNMISKFLCYSSPQASLDQDPSVDATTNPMTKIERSSSCGDLVPFLPEPILKPQEKLQFQRNVLWKFEDTKMLIGSNMPIFGGGKYPAVSLRLNDCAKPINVLTGLDYWLDNLMCNVPEVVMCFHMDGIVQKYEHYKTEELPNIDGSQFSPKVIKDVARNILSFLKSNCTMEGHTYWLFKGNGSDVVKLYDLTSLCDKTSGHSGNPFSIPVAMLLYRVCKNMMNQSELRDNEQKMVQVLLTNCINLLNNEPCPDDHLEIITSSHFLMAQMYSLTNKKCEGGEYFENCCPLSSDDEDFPWPKLLTLSDLSKSNSFEEPYDDIKTDLPVKPHEKLFLSLSHVVQALKTLHRVVSDRKESGNECMRHTMLPSRPYLLALPDAAFTARLWQEFEPEVSADMMPLNFNFRQWKGTFESVLVRKAAGLYLELGSLAHDTCDHGSAVRCLRLCLLLLTSYRSLEWVNASEELDMLPTVLCRCADVYLALAKSRGHTVSSNEVDYGQISEHEEYFTTNYRITEETIYDLKIDTNADVDVLFRESETLYERALDVANDSHDVHHLVSLTRRLGSVRNELGLFYMNSAEDTTANVKDIKVMWKKSLDSFTAGVRAFEAVDDRANIALIHSNCGRLMRTCAQRLFNTSEKRGEVLAPERAYYTSAVEYYNKSLAALGERKQFPEIWDRISWELSGTYYTMGTLFQEHYSEDECEAEREISHVMFKSLKLCETLVFPYEHLQREVTHRVGTIHYRLASLYHNSLRMMTTCDPIWKKKRHLAEYHYDQAADFIDVSMYPTEWLRVNLERVALMEHQVRSKGFGLSKIYHRILFLLFTSKKAFQVYFTAQGKLSDSVNDNEKDANTPPDEWLDDLVQFRAANISTHRDMNSGNVDNEFLTLMDIFESRLKHCLQNYIKVLSSVKTNVSTQHKERENVLKRMFEFTLRRSVEQSCNVRNPVELSGILVNTVTTLQQLYDSVK